MNSTLTTNLNNSLTLTLTSMNTVYNSYFEFDKELNQFLLFVKV